MTREIGGLAEIAEAFDGVLIDQFGVLHDGASAFPGARDCLEALAAHGRPVVAITNSGKRAAPNLARLERLGFPAPLFRALVSSGELARARLEARLSSGALRRDAPVLLLARDGDRSLIEGLPLRAVPLGEDADLALIAGVEPERISRADYAAGLAPLARRGAPAICANPDTVMYVEGGAAFGAGLVASDYAAAGGALEMLGKPDRAMFDAALALLNGAAPARVLMIGDSPEHDIAGAAGAGCATLLIRAGVQAGIAGGAAPDFAMDRLIWRRGAA